MSDFQRNDRAPAGADCGFGWASNYSFVGAGVSQDELDFFQAAADIQRRAAEKRYAMKNMTEGDQYMDQEIVLRRQLLQQALVASDLTSNDTTRRAIVQHLSYLVAAMALRQQYRTAADYLEDKPASIIDDQALKVWLQAVWSCAKWDGNKGNVCATDNVKLCQDKVGIFLESIALMKNKTFPPQTRRDIEKLRELTSSNGCLK